MLRDAEQCVMGKGPQMERDTTAGVQSQKEREASDQATAQPTTESGPVSPVHS